MVSHIPVTSVSRWLQYSFLPAQRYVCSVRTTETRHSHERWDTTTLTLTHLPWDTGASYSSGVPYIPYSQDDNHMNNHYDLKALIGQTITKVLVGTDDNVVVFVAENNKFFEYSIGGDCCSLSWLESINNIENMLNTPILEIHSLSLPDDYIKKAQDDPKYEVLEIWGYTIKTIKGHTDIEFRNDSNGYYSGSFDQHNGGQLLFDNGNYMFKWFPGDKEFPLKEYK